MWRITSEYISTLNILISYHNHINFIPTDYHLPDGIMYYHGKSQDVP
jgi:hypothetical protein